jgi:hypothetical protein
MEPDRYLNFFRDTSTLKTLESLDPYLEISPHWNMQYVLELHEKKRVDGLMAVLQMNLQKEKFKVGDISRLEKFIPISQLIKPEYFRKFPSFFLGEKVADFLIRHPEKADDLYSLADDGHLEHFWDLQWFLEDNIENFLSVPREKRALYVSLYLRINKSPSQEIKRIKNELILQLLAVDNPEKMLDRIEEIFIRNNLPSVGKIYKIFAIIHSPEKLDEVLKYGEHLSPSLRESSERKRYFTIYRDLIRVNVQSGNKSLEDYLKLVDEGQKVFDKIERQALKMADVMVQGIIKQFPDQFTC